MIDFNHYCPRTWLQLLYLWHDIHSEFSVQCSKQLNKTFAVCRSSTCDVARLTRVVLLPQMEFINSIWKDASILGQYSRSWFSNGRPTVNLLFPYTSYAPKKSSAGALDTTLALGVGHRQSIPHIKRGNLRSGGLLVSTMLSWLPNSQGISFLMNGLSITAHSHP